MKIYTKILIGSWLLASLILWYSFTFWESKDLAWKEEHQITTSYHHDRYEEAEKIAQEYITANLGNEFWKDEIPTLWEWTPMYMEKTIPSYIEYEILCKRENGCGFIVINVDGDDVKVPTFSFTGKTPTNILTLQSWKTKNQLHFYYFSPLSIYAQYIPTGQLYAFNPQLNPIEYDRISSKITHEEKEAIYQRILDQKEKLSEIFYSEKKAILEYKQSPDFQIYLQDKEKNTSLAFPQGWWKIIPGILVPWCDSVVPCYIQHNYNYVTAGTTQVQNCATGCVPVAIAIIFWYHDRQTKENLIRWATAPMLNTGSYDIDGRVRHMIAEIRWYVGTRCVGIGGATKPWATPYGVEYAKAQGYSTSSYGTILPNPIDTYNTLSTEINNGRPALIGVKWPGGWHAIVWYAYSTDTSSGKRIIINAGWWQERYPNLPINLHSFSFGTTNNSSTHLTTLDGGYTFKIQ